MIAGAQGSAPGCSDVTIARLGGYGSVLRAGSQPSGRAEAAAA